MTARRPLFYMSQTALLVMPMKAGCPFWPYSICQLRSICWTAASFLHVCMTFLACLARLKNGFRLIYLTHSSLSASVVRSFHRRSFSMGFLRVLSWALFSLPCTPSRCLILFRKIFRCNHPKFADDTQLHQSITPSDFQLVHNIEHCVDSFGRWITCNRLKLNNDKTEALVA